MYEYGPSFRYIADELKNDKSFCLEMLELNAGSYEYMPDYIRDDEDIFIWVVGLWDGCIEMASEKILLNKNIMIYLIKRGLMEEFPEYVTNDMWIRCMYTYYTEPKIEKKYGSLAHYYWRKYGAEDKIKFLSKNDDVFDVCPSYLIG